MVLVDSHCHIPLVEGNADQIIADALSAGIGHMLCVAVELDGVPDILQLAARHDCVSASVGVHPNAEVAVEPDVETLVGAAADPRVVAIGETGLDYYRSQGDLEWQRQRFRVHIRAARTAKKPLIIHSRQAKQDVLSILAEEGADEVGGVMHCFVDDWDTACRAMDLNFLISFSGIVTFKNAQPLQDVARQVPLDRMLVETDSPYLAPVPYRGKQNEPALVRYVAEQIAGLQRCTVESVAETTTDNFFRVFRDAARAPASA